MSHALAKTIVTDRLVDYFCSPEQQAKYAAGDLLDEDLRGVLREKVFGRLEEIPTSKHITYAEYARPEDDFKVLERPGTKELSAEQAQSLKDIQGRCGQHLHNYIISLDISRCAVHVEKFIVINGKEAAIIPLALITVTIRDPQQRCPAFTLTRRLAL